jgi:Ni/Co efflux regulator RcnB
MTDTAERQHSPSRDWGQGSSGEQLRQQRRDGRNRDRSVMERAVEQSRIRNGEVSVHRDRDRDRRSHNRQSGADRRWNNHWRSDRNYDWRNYRHHNRSVFRQGNYWDPYGSRYRHFSIGFSLFPSYYRSDYWLRDPWQYRLPPAYGPYRWIRYYNDALLVDIYSGQVIDVERNFFW